MIRVQGFYLYQLGYQLHPLAELAAGSSSWNDAFWACLVAEGALNDFLYSSVYRPRTCQQHGADLLSAIRDLRGKAEQQEDGSEVVPNLDLYGVKTGIAQFEAVLSAEFGVTALYVVAKKGAYDTSELIENGIALFPEDLPNKVKEAVPDIMDGARCLAFELSTAAGFHFHRANESVLHKYYDAVTDGAPRPGNRNMGDYIAELVKLEKGDPKVLSALRALKDLHRNPLIHPDHSLETVEEAVSLLGAIRSAVGYMLEAIPGGELEPTVGGAV